MTDTYKILKLKKRPQGETVLGETFEEETQAIPKGSSLQDGQVLVEVLYLSLDPAMRTWLDGMSLVETNGVIVDLKLARHSIIYGPCEDWRSHAWRSGVQSDRQQIEEFPKG